MTRKRLGQKAAVAPLPSGPPSARGGPWTAPPDFLLRNFLHYPPLLTSFCCVQHWGVLGAVWCLLAAWRSQEGNVSSVPAPSLVRLPRSPPPPCSRPARLSLKARGHLRSPCPAWPPLSRPAAPPTPASPGPRRFVQCVGHPGRPL